MGSNFPFVDPLNPPEILGIPQLVTTISIARQDINGDVGELDVRSKIRNPNPNPNNDPLADDWTFKFTFDLPNDGWQANVKRTVSGKLDVEDAAGGSWNPYGAGTQISLVNPKQPLSGQPSDWYLDGTNADDAWTLLNIVHNHPGPITFSFTPYTEAFLTQYKPKP